MIPYNVCKQANQFMIFPINSLFVSNTTYWSLIEISKFSGYFKSLGWKGILQITLISLNIPYFPYMHGFTIRHKELDICISTFSSEIEFTFIW